MARGGWGSSRGARYGRGGDSFLAGLIYGLLVTQEDATATLRRSAALASFVASSAGATPDYDIGEFIAHSG